VVVPADRTQALELGTAVLGSSGAVIVRAPLRPVWAEATCAGPARTARCAAGDNLAVHAAVATVKPGEVLVVAVDGQRDCGYWGEVLTVAAQARGAAGLVIDACVRDTEALARRRFPVFSTGVALPDATKDGPGSTGEPVTLGETSISTGDVVVADADGVVVIASDRLGEVVARGVQRTITEAAMFEALAAGETTVTLLGLEQRVEEMEGL